MKNLRKKFPSMLRRDHGFALIIVLSCLLFITALIVTFLVSMRTEVASSKASADSTQARQLGDMAVNLAIAQIREATLTAGSQKLAWASQPGMIRLYDSQGNAAGYRKLYTWDNMVGTGAFDPFANGEQVDAAWKSNGAIYADLNEPILSGGNWVFPIFNEEGAKTLGVQGVGVTSAPGVKPNDTQQAPMPVKWLYVLADGSVHLPTGGGDVATVAAASASNPIVGRIAFWADDETCKININTASEGSFWATPRFVAQAEYDLAYKQPARGEFQGYPGHPSTVSLRTVFSKLTAKDILAFAPRLEFGGSEGGTKEVQDVGAQMPRDQDRLFASVEELQFKAPSGSSGQGQRVASDKLTKQDVDASKFFLTAHSRAPELNLFGLPRILSWPIHETNDDKYRTINDRLLAFCATLGGKSFYFTRQQNMSPVDDLELISRNVELLKYLDGLTGRNVPGFGGDFRTKYPDEMRQILIEIFDYIRCTNLTDLTTPLSGSGTDLQAPYAFGISPRKNSYLVLGKRDGGRSSGIGQAMPIYFEEWDALGFGGRYLTINEAHIQFTGVGRGEIAKTDTKPYQPPVPVYDTGNNERKAGGSNSRQEGVRTWNDLYTDEQSIKDALSAGDPNIQYNKIPYNFEGNNIPPPNKLAMQSFFMLSTLVPAEGIEFWVPGQWIEVEGLNQFQVQLEPGGPLVSMGFPAKASMTIMGNMMGGGGVGGAKVHSLNAYGFVVAQNEGKLFNKAYVGSGDERRDFPLYSHILPLDLSLTQMNFKGGDVTVRIYGDAKWPNTEPFKPGELIQEYTINFPDSVFPVPELANMRRIGTGVKAADPDERTNPNNPKSDFLAHKDKHDRWGVHNNQVASWLIDLKRDSTNKLVGFNDVFKSISLSNGDSRLLARRKVDKSLFAAQPEYHDVTKRVVYGFPGAITLSETTDSLPYKVAGTVAAGTYSIERGKLVADAAYRPNNRKAPFVPKSLNGAYTASGALGDWDNGTADTGDGPYINAADPGSLYSDISGASIANNERPYFGNSNTTSSSRSQFFSPNRQIPSPVMFGSLPTGVKRGLPWQTLLFRPGPDKHPGIANPKDHLLLDLFWMPVVEPYAISEPFSTAGKINMNQQLVPFTYINRMTGLYAAMAAERVAVVPFSAANNYKEGGLGTSVNTREEINMSETNGTLRQFKKLFSEGKIFRSASEICDIYLVPKSEQWTTDESANAAWYAPKGKFAMVGDNVRERPYAHLYNKVTTKSNTYTVHYRVQSLAIPKSENQTQFDPAKGSKVTAESRGSSTIERYIDPNDPRFLADSSTSNATAVNFLAEPGKQVTVSPDFSFEPFYRFHVLQSSTFAP